MVLDERSLNQLRRILEYREHPPTPTRLLSYSLKAYLYLFLLYGAAVCFFYWGGWPIVSGVFFGMFVATVSRDWHWFQQQARNWPMLREIINWKHLEELVVVSSAPKA
jgi:hypothetical protein